MQQQEMQLLTAEYKGYPVLFHDDGFINATQVAKHYGKRSNDFLNTESAKRKKRQIQEKLVLQEKQVVIALSGSPDNGGGTWLHPKLAVTFAMWLNDDFAWWVEEQIEAILKGEFVGKITEAESILLDRIELNSLSFHPDYITVFDESLMVLKMLAANGVPIGHKTLPDISIGSAWAKNWNEKNLASIFNERVKLVENTHIFPESFPQSKGYAKIPWSYPAAVYPVFRRWLVEVYIPESLLKYLLTKEKQKLLPPGSADKILISANKHAYLKSA